MSKQPAPKCNCRSKSSCPLNGNCMQSSLVYICKADTPNIIENRPHYISLTENTFKYRSYKHKNSFKYESKHNARQLYLKLDFIHFCYLFSCYLFFYIFIEVETSLVVTNKNQPTY